MRSAVAGFAVVLAVGLAAVLALALTQRSSLVYSLGVNPALSAATLTPGARACQAPVRPPTGVAFDRVGILLGTSGEPGPPVRVEVRDAAAGRRLASGRLEPGYPDFDPARKREQVVQVGTVEPEAPLEICVVNEGDVPVSVIGQAGIASPTTSATGSGRPLTTDLTINLRSGERSLAALLPDIAERAARFRAGWVTPTVYLVLAVAIVAGAPLLLARGFARLEER